MLLCCSFLQNCLAGRIIHCTSFPNLNLAFMLGRKLWSPFCMCRVILFCSNGPRSSECLCVLYQFLPIYLISCLMLPSRHSFIFAHFLFLFWTQNLHLFVKRFDTRIEEHWGGPSLYMQLHMRSVRLRCWESIKLRIKDKLLLILDGFASLMVDYQ